jgi:hypothetical protein
MNSDSSQPLYIAPEERVTLEQLKHRAEVITDMATSESKRVATQVAEETKRVATQVAEESLTKVAIVVVGTVLVVASLAYFLGSRAGRRSARPMPPYGG